MDMEEPLLIAETLPVLRSFRIGCSFTQQYGNDGDFISIDFSPLTSPGKRFVATSTSANLISLFDPDEARSIIDLPNTKYGTGLVRFVPGTGGRELIHTSRNSSHDNALRHLDWNKRQYVQYLNCHRENTASSPRIVSMNAGIEKPGLFVTGSEDRVVRLWDVLRGLHASTQQDEPYHVICEVPIRRGVPFVEFGSCASGSRESAVVVIGAGNEIGIRDLRTFSQGPFLSVRIPVQPSIDPRLRESFIRNIRVSPNGRWLLVSCVGVVYGLDSFSGKVLWNRPLHLACSNLEPTTATGGPTAPDMSMGHHHRRRLQALDCVADFVPDSRHCIIGLADGSVVIVESHSGRTMWRMDRCGVITMADEVVVPPDQVGQQQQQQGPSGGESGGGGASGRMDVDRKLVHEGPVLAVRHSPDMTLFATASRELKFWVPVQQRFG